MLVDRFNNLARITQAPTWFLEALAVHLAVPVEPETALGARFGGFFIHEGQRYGSLLRGDVVAAGLVPHVVALAKHYRLTGRVRDWRAKPSDQLPLHAISMQWRPYQEAVFRRTLAYDTGVIDAPPRSGKTAMAARTIDAYALPTLFLAPSVQIVAQTYRTFRKIWGEDLVARIDGDVRPSERDPSKQIVVATVASALALPPEWWATRQLLVIDEFHHAAADSYHRVSQLAVNAFYRYGWTGTHFRTGDDRLAMEAVCSTVIAKIPVDFLVAGGWLARPRVVFSVVNGAPTGGHNYQEAYEAGIVESRDRNDLVVFIAQQLGEQGVPTIVLTRRRAHADALGARIPNSVVVKGGEGALTSKAVSDFLSGRYGCIVGTTVIGEGVDVPRAAALVYAAGGSDGVGMMQSYFRPLTAAEGKPVGRIYDFVDSHHGMLRKQSSRRIEMAREQLGAGNVIVPRGVT